MLPEPPFDKIIDIKVRQVTSHNRDTIARLMLSAKLPYYLPDWWNYEWTVTKDTSGHDYNGTFPKRLKKWLYVEHQHKISDKEASDLGERIKAYLATENTYHIDFTRNIDWSPGTYREGSGSCWWNAHSDAREALVNADGFAMRSYDSQKYPYGRTWVAKRPDMYCLFNAYGGYSTAIYGTVLAHLLELDVRHGIPFTNCRRSGGLIYINGAGSVVGAADDLKTALVNVGDGTPLDFGIDVSEFCYMCNYCGMDMFGYGNPHRIGSYVACGDCVRANKISAVPLFDAAQV